MVKGTTVFVGNLPNNANETEVEDLFAKYGRINSVKARSDPSRRVKFAFIQFDDERDALKAVDGRDGYDFDGNRLIVDMAKEGGPRRHASDNQSNGYKVEISNLPRDTSWQNLRNNFGRSGKILFADVDRHGGGFISFAYREDAKQFVRKFDDTKYYSDSGESSYIRVKEGRNREGSPRRRSSPSRRSRSPRRRSPARRSRSPRRFSPVRNSRSRSSPARGTYTQNPRHYSPERMKRGSYLSPGRLTRSPIEEFERVRNARQPAPLPEARAASPSPSNRNRSHTPRRSISSAGDMRKRSRSSSTNASSGRSRSYDSRSPPPAKKARSASSSPRRRSSR